MTWLRIFTKCVLAVALAGLILRGFFFAAILLCELVDKLAYIAAKLDDVMMLEREKKK